MLKNELDQKVRDYRIKQPPFEEQQAEMAERIKKDSNYVWEALKKVFIRKYSVNKPLNIIVGICNNSNDTQGTGHVYFKLEDDILYRRLVFKKVKYIKETMEAIREIAESEGIICEHDKWEPRLANFLIYRTATWYKFTYEPPEE